MDSKGQSYIKGTYRSSQTRWLGVASGGGGGLGWLQGGEGSEVAGDRLAFRPHCQTYRCLRDKREAGRGASEDQQGGGGVGGEGGRGGWKGGGGAQHKGSGIKERIGDIKHVICTKNKGERSGTIRIVQKKRTWDMQTNALKIFRYFE